MLPESAFIAVVHLLVALITLVSSSAVSLTQRTQRWRIFSRVSPGDAARIEVICHTWWQTNTHTYVQIPPSSFYIVCVYSNCVYSSYPVRCRSPSQTCNPGLWSIPEACSSQLFDLSQCGRFFFLPGCWCWWHCLLSSPQLLRSRRHQYLRQQVLTAHMWDRDKVQTFSHEVTRMLCRDYRRW